MPDTLRPATALVIAAVLGGGALAYLYRGPTPGVPPTPTPTAQRTPATTLPPLRGGLLAPGPYVYDRTKVHVVLTVPEGWEGGPFSISKAPARELPDGTNILFRYPTQSFTDPCAPDLGAGKFPAFDDLVEAWADLPNVTDMTVSDVRISGHGGKHLSFTVDTKGIDCVMALYGQDTFIRAAEDGQRQDLWYLDVDGTSFLIDAATFPLTPASDRAEMLAIVESLVLEDSD